MRIVHRAGPLDTWSGDRVVDLEIDDPATTAAHLADVLTAGSVVPPPGLIVDGRWCPPDTALDQLDLRVGSVVESSPTPPEPAPAPERVVAIVGGTRAGASARVGGSFSIGRAREADLRVDDPSVGAGHVAIEGVRFARCTDAPTVLLDASPADEGEVGPSSVLTLGASQFELRVPIDDRPQALRTGHARRDGVVPFNRPPRTTPAIAAAPLSVPAEPEPPSPVEPPSIAALVLPVIAGGLLAYFFSPFMAVFTALGPILSLGTWWERRRRGRRAHRRALAEIAAAVDRLRLAAPSLVAAERRRRRLLVPDPAEVVRRAADGSVRLWERRSDHGDAHLVGVGVSPTPYVADLQADDGGTAAQLAVDTVAAFPALTDVPIDAVLGPGVMIGVVGPAAARRAIARSLLLQMCVHHGPADLAAVVASDTEGRAAWRWAEWLPHCAHPASGEPGGLVVGTADLAGAELALAAAHDGAVVLGILDDPAAFEGRHTVGRRLAADPGAAAVVLVEHVHQLPARTAMVITCDEWGRVEVSDPATTAAGRRGLAWGLDASSAESAARALAQLDDPELQRAGVGIPDAVSLLRLLDIDASDPAVIGRRWAARMGDAGLVAPIGADRHGAVDLDLVADGPHALVGGTTGAGKSELLRSLVASLAATYDPDHVAFVLVDYKGGAAFDCCADLPHVAGMVTDLDADLAARALECLDAELRHREHRLRAVGAEDIRAFRAVAARRDDLEPLPRLVLVVDEFASLAADLPDFLDSLVGIAQRGRSLGVHMILATQRPAGVITDNIKANTGCRIALRVTDPHESNDVIDVGDAAAIPRDRPGRAFARLGPGELVGFQSALVTGSTEAAGPIRVVSVDPRGEQPCVDAEPGETDLERLVRAVCAAHGDRPLPRSPWPDPLPAAGAAGTDGWWLVDDPSNQRHVVDGWQPADGHLVIVGGPRSGTSTTAAAAAITAVDGGAHVYAIDLDGGSLVELESLPSVGAVVSPVDSERRVRMLRRLVAEIERRQDVGSDGDVPIVLVIDDVGGLSRAHDPVRETEPHDALDSIWAAGPGVGVTCVVTVGRAADLTPAMLAAAPNVVVQRLADPTEATRFGLRSMPAAMPPGRAVRADDGAVLQVLLPDGSIGRAVDERIEQHPVTPPWRIGRLDAVIPLASVGAAATSPWSTTFAVRDRDLAPTGLALDPGEHALVVGPIRSGRTSTLEAIGRLHERVLVVADGESELAARLGLVATPAGELGDVADLDGWTVLVDDASEIDDIDGRLAALIATRARPHVVASVRNDRLRNAYGHWTSEIRSSRTGVLLQPDTLDGDLLGAAIPGRLDLPARPGRGVIVRRGTIESVQVAVADRISGQMPPG